LPCSLAHYRLLSSIRVRGDLMDVYPLLPGRAQFSFFLRNVAFGLGLLVWTACAAERQDADKIYAIPPDVLQFHQELVRLSAETAMAISSDAKAVGGAYCIVGSDAPCGPAKLTSLALQKCRANGGRDCVLFAVGKQIAVRFVVIGLCTDASSRFVTTEAACRDANGTFSSLPVAAPPPPPPSVEAPPKDAATLALESAVVAWINNHPSEFRRMLDTHLRQHRLMPVDPAGELGVNKVGSVVASRTQHDEYKITISYVLTRGGMPTTVGANPEVRHAERKSFEVRFDGNELRFF
jgi:hypothetical protein